AGSHVRGPAPGRGYRVVGSRSGARARGGEWRGSDRGDRSRRSRRHGAAARGGRGAMTREKVLIVDDEESIRNQLKWGLAEEYEVLTAASAAEAWRLLREQRPGLVTLDVALSPSGGPRDEGLELLDQIVDGYPLTKVIMVTASDSRENALLAIRRGATDWYAKPIELEDLRFILRRALHIRRIEASSLIG